MIKFHQVVRGIPPTYGNKVANQKIHYLEYRDGHYIVTRIIESGRERQKKNQSQKLLWNCPGGSAGGKSACNAGDLGSIPGLGGSPGGGKGYPRRYSGLEISMDCIHWRRKWQPTPGLLPGKSYGWRSLVGCSPWGRKSRTRLSDFTFTFHFHALEKEMATHSSVLAWRIPGMVEPDGLPSMGSHRVRHNWSDLAAAAANVW